jgi:hypothetical protein
MDFKYVLLWEMKWNPLDKIVDRDTRGSRFKTCSPPSLSELKTAYPVADILVSVYIHTTLLPWQG